MNSLRPDLISRLHWAILRGQRDQLLDVLRDVTTVTGVGALLRWVEEKIRERRRPHQETLRFVEGVLWREQ